jgi:hypothetical protein
MLVQLQVVVSSATATKPCVSAQAVLPLLNERPSFGASRGTVLDMLRDLRMLKDTGELMQGRCNLCRRRQIER